MLRITAYAERLINELEGLDWPEGIKLLQRNWIGKSEGAEIDFKMASASPPMRSDHRQDGATKSSPRDRTRSTARTYWCSRRNIRSLIGYRDGRADGRRCAKYRRKTARKSDLERTDLAKEKTGVFTGAYAINPATSEKIPIWIADYVLLGYGTGAIMGVPAHDERDLEFAQKFDLPVVDVVQPRETNRQRDLLGEGIAINSPIINGLTTAEAKTENHQNGWRNAV